MTEYHEEPLRKCEFCQNDGRWPNIFWTPPYWTHSTCLVKAVEEGRRSPETYR